MMDPLFDDIDEFRVEFDIHAFQTVSVRINKEDLPEGFDILDPSFESDLEAFALRAVTQAQHQLVPDVHPQIACHIDGTTVSVYSEYVAHDDGCPDVLREPVAYTRAEHEIDYLAIVDQINEAREDMPPCQAGDEGSCMNPSVDIHAGWAFYCAEHRDQIVAEYEAAGRP